MLSRAVEPVTPSPRTQFLLRPSVSTFLYLFLLSFLSLCFLLFVHSKLFPCFTHDTRSAEIEESTCLQCPSVPYAGTAVTTPAVPTDQAAPKISSATSFLLPQMNKKSSWGSFACGATSVILSDAVGASRGAAAGKRGLRSRGDAPSAGVPGLPGGDHAGRRERRCIGVGRTRRLSRGRPWQKT